MKNLVAIIFAMLFVTSCQQKPTKVVAQEAVIGSTLTAENLIKQKAVILDARAPFEFNISHVPGAINVQWEDFSQPNSIYKGLLQNDLFALARRLALIGIDPETKVVVLGKGSQGQGEEGRIAWTLNVLGVRDVYTLHHNSYREMNVTKEAPPVENKPYWKPQVQEPLMVTFKVFKQLATNKDSGIVLIDVRSSQEFELHNIPRKSIKARLINIEWKQFFDEKGLPDKQVETKLSALSIAKDSKIVVLSNHGVRSGAATYALTFLGYTKASNFAGGYEQWK